MCRTQKKSILIDVVFPHVSDEQIESLIDLLADLLACERIRELEAMRGANIE